MAGIGPDIASVRDELGSSVSIVRLNVSEKIDLSLKESANDPFTQDHVFDASFSYNTKIEPGDILVDNGTSDPVSYLVMNKTADDFEDEVVEYAGILFKCNLPQTSLIVSPTSVTNTDYTITQGWTEKANPAYGFIKNTSQGTIADKGAMFGENPRAELKCLVPASYDVKRADRVILSPTEYYRVEYVDRHIFKACHVLTLVEDDRPVL